MKKVKLEETYNQWGNKHICKRLQREYEHGASAKMLWDIASPQERVAAIQTLTAFQQCEIFVNLLHEIDEMLAREWALMVPLFDSNQHARAYIFLRCSVSTAVSRLNWSPVQIQALIPNAYFQMDESIQYSEHIVPSWDYIMNTDWIINMPLPVRFKGR
jgi:hypothetical protein